MAHPPDAILLDALGTLVRLVDPFSALREELRTRGVEVSADECRAALSAEMRFYRAHCREAGDAEALASLRRRCAAVLTDALPDRARTRARAAEPDLVLDALLAAIRFEAFGDVAPALARWRAAGARLAVVSNWDVSLHGVLAQTGIASAVDAVLTSAELGASKPDPAIFSAALRALAVDPARAVHVGDTLAEDVAGARAAGIEPVLLARDGAAPAPGVRTVRSLDEVWP